MAPDDVVANALRDLHARSMPGGGFSGQPEGDYRPDATAWAAVACRAFQQPAERLAGHLDRLARGQLSDGRVPISIDHPQAFWPTAEAVLAWRGSVAHQDSQRRATEFLLKISGKHYKRSKQFAEVMGHDPSIKGWPWIEGTHSWVEPTAMNLLALETVGQIDHPRCREARRMLLDRQLESGGWNYGNTKTFCLELRPSMESTGLALHALAGQVPLADVRRSVDYLERELPRTRTPLWLAWSVLGLSAWGRRPEEAEAMISECLARQVDYGRYDTAWIGVLLSAVRCKQGLVRQFETSAAEAA